MSFSTKSEKDVIDWLLGGASPTRPTAWFVSVHVGDPAKTGGTEVGAGSGYTRKTVAFAAAATPAGTTTNSGAVTFGPFSNAGTVSGVGVWDASAAGSYLWGGTLATARTIGVGDTLVLTAGALTASAN